MAQYSYPFIETISILKVNTLLDQGLVAVFEAFSILFLFALIIEKINEFTSKE